MKRSIIAEIEGLKQIGILTPRQKDIYEEIPVSLEEWLYSDSYLNFDKDNEQLSEIQMNVVKIGTNIYNEIDNVIDNEKGMRLVNELVIQWGKGSGKDWISAIITARIVYKMLCLKSPQKYYKQSKVSHIDLLNMAYGEGQAEQTYFSYLKSILKQSPWFIGKCKIKEGIIRFDKNIRAFNGNSFEEAFEGKNLFVCVLDEIAAFKTDDEISMMMRKRMRAPRYTASAVYDMAQTSIASRFGNLGKLLSISFPRYKGDFIQQLYEKRKDDAEAYVSFGATWEVNPKVTRESLNSEYRRHPERSVAKYECKPSDKIDTWMKKPECIEQCFELVSSMEDIGLTDELAPKILPSLKCNHSFPCSIHVDIGWKKDSCGIAMAHIEDVIQEVDSATKEMIELPVIGVDLVTSFIAPREGEIDFDQIRNFLTTLIYRGFNVRLLTFDSYNSVYFMQIFQKMGIETKLRSVDRDTSAYDDLKDLIYCNRIKGKIAPRTLWYLTDPLNPNNKRYIVLEEIKKLVLIADQKIDHRDHGFFGKDEADSLSGSVQGAIELGYRKMNLSEDIQFGEENRNEFPSQDRQTTGNRIGFEDREWLTAPSDAGMGW